MGNRIAFVLFAGLLILTGCSSSGTTYGTGTSHEEATLKSVYNIFSIKPEQRENIDYSARPDLVMPADKGALPQPNSSIEQSDGQAWPETPEERIAAIRAAVPDNTGKNRIGNDAYEDVLPVEFTSKRNKAGIRNSANLYGPDVGGSRASEEPNFIGKFAKEKSGSSANTEIAKRRAELAYSTGSKRKYLTEPPAEYREPAATADAGDLGLDSEFIEERRKAARQAEIDAERGVVDVRGAE